MKVILVVAVLVGAAVARPEPPSSGYGLPSSSFGGGSSFGQGGGGGGGFGGGSAGGQVYRHVYVHAAPDEPEDSQSRVIRIPGPSNKHVNIIFVKTPSQSASQQTEVILPEQDQQKTLVYVLHRKFDASTDLKIRRPAASAPAKPQVYFIRYGSAGGAQGGSTSGGSTGGGISSGNTAYGAF